MTDKTNTSGVPPEFQTNPLAEKAYLRGIFVGWERGIFAAENMGTRHLGNILMSMLSEAARRAGIHSEIRQKLYWAAQEIPLPSMTRPAPDGACVKLTPVDREKIYLRWASEGESQSSIAREYGLTASAVSRICIQRARGFDGRVGCRKSQVSEKEKEAIREARARGVSKRRIMEAFRRGQKTVEVILGENVRYGAS